MKSLLVIQQTELSLDKQRDILIYLLSYNTVHTAKQSLQDLSSFLGGLL